MKYAFLSALTFLLIACGSSENNAEENSAETNPVETDSVPNPDQGEPDTSSTLIELKEKNQVNDYAEYFLQGKVFEDREKMDFEKGDMHYYETLDLKNGYASVTGAYEGSYQFAIWRMANGNDLVGKTSMACGPVCDYNFSFYEITADGDIDVTDQIMPMDEIQKQRQKMEDKATADGKMEKDSFTQLRFILPQKGTSMDVYLSMNSNELEFPIVTLSWNKEKFTVSKKFDVIP